MAEAADLLAQYGDDAKLIAGGAAVVLLISHRMITPTALISLARIPGHNDIRNEPDGLVLGALATIRDVEQSPLVRRFCPALAHAYAVVANVRVRNQGTVGGNLVEADYASDPPAMLCALDARVRVASRNKTRSIPVREFYLGFYMTAINSDEIVQDVVVPPLPERARAAYIKFTSRSSEARPSVAVAAVAEIDAAGRCQGLRVAVGAAVPTPQRLPDVEARTHGEQLSDWLIQAIASDYADKLEPIDDALESAWYRKQVIRVNVRRALLEVQDSHW